MSSKAAEAGGPSPLKLVGIVSAWYVFSTAYNVFNKKAANMIHAHWFIAAAQLVVGIVWSITMWSTGLRKKPNLSAGDFSSCIPIGVFACLSHGGSVLSMGVGAVSFAQIVKACEPVFAAVVALIVPPVDIKPVLAYLMLIPIIAGVALACVKEGKGVDINVAAFMYASLANVGGALKGKLGKSVTESLQKDKDKNMDSANVYAVMNIISFLFTSSMVVASELPTLKPTWEQAVAEHGAQPIIINITLSGFFYYVYNELAFKFTTQVGVVTSSVLNTAKRVIIIVVSCIIFSEPMERNTIIGAAMVIAGTFAYSITSKKNQPEKKDG